MTVLLRHYWLSLGLFTEGRRWHDRALAVGSDSPEAAWAVYGAGVLSLQQGALEQAEPLLARAAELAQDRHDPDLRAHVTDAQAIASFFAGTCRRRVPGMRARWPSTPRSALATRSRS